MENRSSNLVSACIVIVVFSLLLVACPHGTEGLGLGLGSGPSYQVGSTGPAGGVIIYENPNYATDGWRYMEAAPDVWGMTSVDPKYIFGYYRTTSTGPNQFVGTGTEIGTGEANTMALVEAMGRTAYSSDTGLLKAKYAAKVCADYAGGGYDDWFLPSKDELNLMYTNLKTQWFESQYDDGYWSSSENHANSAWIQVSWDGFLYSSYCPRDIENLVRPVRTF